MNTPPSFFRCDEQANPISALEDCTAEIFSNLTYGKDSALDAARNTNRAQVIYKIVLVPVYRVDCVTTYPTMEYPQS